MSVLFFPPTTEDHPSSKECNAVEVGEDDGQSSVQAEQLHRPKLGDCANSKCKYICKEKAIFRDIKKFLQQKKNRGIKC